MRQWNEVEAAYAHSYHLSLDDIFDMSWRRFRVLFRGIFNWSNEEEAVGEPARISSAVDWGQAEHVPVSELGGISVNRIPVGKDVSG